ncbi:unnamed protein product, partial [Mesorhabditis spiculigera]
MESANLEKNQILISDMKIFNCMVLTTKSAPSSATVTTAKKSTTKFRLYKFMLHLAWYFEDGATMGVNGVYA